ncbi:hypothetical protein GBAR_LOCUS20611, partial [Geodia barretti]
MQQFHIFWELSHGDITARNHYKNDSLTHTIKFHFRYNYCLCWMDLQSSILSLPHCFPQNLSSPV